MLSQKYVKALLDGRKRSTIRPGVLKVADRVYIHSMGKIVAIAEVEQVAYKRVSELTDEDAIIDGFNSRAELISYLKRRYPGLRDSAIVTIVKFRKVEKVDMPEDAHYGGMTPVEIATLALNRLKLSPREQRILKAVVEAGSLRKAALKIFGTVEKRGVIRRVLRKAAMMLTHGGLGGETESN
ncbi:MAG: ASCH domain-containing protein [Pyrobaculum aerophilum]|nr:MULTISPECIES: ASCH domain-containing protein [Pyrobaculum]MCX8136421.1 ASCH domain-containing protein [Pyrobaculum aerophilum]HII47246.1 ASCH domain-containing protein [Pyrobaculum aerophilum]